MSTTRVLSQNMEETAGLAVDRRKVAFFARGIECIADGGKELSIVEKVKSTSMVDRGRQQAM